MTKHLMLSLRPAVRRGAGRIPPIRVAGGGTPAVRSGVFSRCRPQANATRRSGLIPNCVRISARSGERMNHAQ